MNPELRKMWDQVFPKVENPRAFTEAELREKVLKAVRDTARYWADVALPPDRDNLRSRCDGVAFSILAMFDGSNIGLPLFEIVARPHEDDKEFSISEKCNWVEDGTVINADVNLHDFYHKGL